ncbi:MAG: sulfotransferase [Acetobacterales bacterium]
MSDALLSYGLGGARPAAKVERSEPQLFAEAQQCTDAGDLDRAETLLDDLLARRPGHPLTLHELGRVANRRGDAARAAELIRQAIEAAPDIAPFHVNLGNALQRLERYDESIAAFRRAAELQPDFPEAHHNLGLALSATGRHEEAAEAIGRAVAIRPDYARGLNALAAAQRDAGRDAEAIETLHRLRRIDPEDVAAAGALLDLRPASAGDPGIDLLERAAADAGRPLEDRRRAFFALARAYDDLGEFDRAFAAACNGHALVSASGGGGFDVARFRLFVDRTIELLDQDFLAARTAAGAPSAAPVFVVGTPAAGADAVGRAIAAHPSAAGGGEPAWLETVRHRIEAELGAPFPDCAAALTPAGARTHGEDYLTRMAATGGEAERVVDAAPLNFQLLGLVALLLPGARVVHCIRDPRETCLSCFMTDAAGRWRFAADLDLLAGFQKEYERLMEHWRGALPVEMMEVFHDDLQRDAAGEMKALVDFIGLPWDEACTPPAPRRDFDWRNYDRHLGPVLTAFGRD